jgi:uncharacterized protein YndB with AHSA1/START domain
VRIREEAVLGASVAEAWAALVQWEDQARWMKDADFVRIESDAREGVGVRLSVKTRVLGIPLFVERLEVIEWEPPRRMVVRHGSFVHGTGEWLLESAPGNRCTFRWTEDLRLDLPVAGELALRAYRPFMRHLMRGSLAGFQSLVSATDST